MRNIISTRKRRLVAGAVAVGAIGAASFAFAAWTASGTGNGYAKATTAQNLTTVDVSASTTATLYPGANGDLLIKISNPNPYAVTVTGVSGNGTITADAGHSLCGSDGTHPTGVTFTNQTGLNISVPASGSTQTTLSGSVHMANTSDNSCQGATFTVPVSLSGTS
jgi:hypothetical protein